MIDIQEIPHEDLLWDLWDKHGDFRLAFVEWAEFLIEKIDGFDDACRAKLATPGRPGGDTSVYRHPDWIKLKQLAIELQLDQGMGSDATLAFLKETFPEDERVQALKRQTMWTWKSRAKKERDAIRTES